MEPKGISLGRGGGGNNGKTADGFIDRSKVRILLCDNDSRGSGEVFTLLRKCSYQVISVKSPRQVIDVLNAEGPNIDIILSEVDLPMAKGLKMLKYIMRKELQRIPVIMMSAQDEVTLVVKCLRLGAADYLVKPLRTNELLNLWTHMWRRRRMLGLAEKKIMICEFDMVPSDPSDGNTNSTVFSDDTDEKSRKSANPEITLPTHRRDEINVLLAPGPKDTQLVRLSNDQYNVQKNNDHQIGEFISRPKKSELKLGQSSAFFTYVKSNTSTKTPPLPRVDKKLEIRGEKDDISPDFLSLNDSSTPSLPPTESSPQINSKTEEISNNSNPNVSGYNPLSPYPYYLYQNNTTISEVHNMLPQYNHGPHYPPNHHHHHMQSFPYYPMNLCGQMGPMVHPWPTFGSSSASVVDQKMQMVDRREAALIKFRQKRKERCFDKKIRYVNRKKLAERRPRVKGQFVRKVNGINVDLNGDPTSNEFDYEDEDEEEY